MSTAAAIVTSARRMMTLSIPGDAPAAMHWQNRDPMHSRVSAAYRRRAG